MQYIKTSNNMKKFVVFLFCLLSSSLLLAQKPLKFNTNGEFKIVQFTDLHYNFKKPQSKAAIKCIEEVTATEKPDLMIFTGDNIYTSPADSCLEDLLSHIENIGIPYVMLFGNHDEEQGLPNEALYDIIRKAKNNIMPDRNGVASPDYTLEVMSHDGKTISTLLYCMDTHSGSQLSDIDGYAWVTPQQVNWYNEQSANYTRKNNGTPYPALAFFHIPLPEYAYAAADNSCILRGNRLENICCPKLNSGLYTSMKMNGDVMATFCGHDHDNDYSALYHGILLCYGRFSGGNTEYNNLPNGARIIVLKEGKRSFGTWIHLRKGGTEQKTTYPDSYLRVDYRTRPLEEGL